VGIQFYAELVSGIPVSGIAISENKVARTSSLLFIEDD
jgi:hypothetical protein